VNGDADGDVPDGEGPGEDDGTAEGDAGERAVMVCRGVETELAAASF
jgi:hypothetical protein